MKTAAKGSHCSCYTGSGGGSASGATAAVGCCGAAMATRSERSPTHRHCLAQETWAVSKVLMATRLICGACNPQCWAGLDWSCASVAQHRHRTAGAGMDDKLASCNGALILSGLSSTDSGFQRPAGLALASLMTRALRARGTLTKPIGRAHGGRGGVRGSGTVPGTLSMLCSATGPIRSHGRGLKAWSKWPWAVVHAGGPATASQCGA